MVDDVTFQSSTLATPASGTVIAADDVSSVFYQRVKVDLGADGAASPLVRGQLGDANSLPVTLSTEGTAQVGSLTEAAPATDTASSGLNGRLQRIAQRLTSILAKLPALGTAGTASTDVITVQGIAAMTAIAVSQSGTWDEVGINDSGNSITVDNPQLSVIGSGTEAAAMRVTIATDSTGVLSVDDNGGALTVDNGGTFAVQVDGAALTALQLIDDPVVQDDVGVTPGTTKVMMVGFEADETATDSVDEGDGGMARMTLDRKVITNPQPHTAGGLSVAQLNGADGGGGVLVATAQAVKASAGQLYGYYIYNPNATAIFVHFYNTAAASVTVGTTNPLMSVTIPALTAANLAFPYGVTFSNAGWSAAATTTAGGNTAPGTGLDVTVFYL